MAFIKQILSYFGQVVYWLVDRHFGKGLFLCFCLCFAYLSKPIVCGYHPKARQSEAKIALSALYGEQKAHYSEFSSYYQRLNDFGFVRESNNSYYIIGVPFGCAELAGLKESEAYFVAGRGPASMLQEHKEEVLAYLRSIDPKYYPCPEPNSGFELFAVGKLDSSQPLDIWKIDQNKNLVNVQSGIKPD